MLKLKVLIIILLTLQIFCKNNEIFINYGVDRQGIELFKFFYDVTDGYYVDIGAYDSIYASNTLNLQVIGWDGINIDASPSRLPRFIYSRPWEASLNYAIGDEDKIMTLYQLTEDSSSTVSETVRDIVKGYKPVVNQVKVPSLSLKQICYRFFQRRPLFLNLDIEGYGSKALQGNDWMNEKCVPQIIFSQINYQTTASGLPLPQKILLSHGYQKWQGNIGLNQVYIHSSVFKKYEQKYKIGTQITQDKTIIGIDVVGSMLAKTLNIPTYLVTHHQPTSDNIFYHFVKPSQIVDLYSLNKYSNQISDKKNRPILLIHFNPHSNTLLMKNQRYSTQVLNLAMYTFYVINIYKDKGEEFTVFVFDHFIQPNILPKIIVSSQKQRSSHKKITFSQLKSILAQPNNFSISEEGRENVEIQLGKFPQLLKNISKISNKTYSQLQMALNSNHNYDEKQLNKILKKCEILMEQMKKMQINNRELNNQVQKQTYSGVKSIIKNLIFVLFAVFFSFLIVNVFLCIAHNPTKPKRRTHYRINAENSQQSKETEVNDQFKSQLSRKQSG